MEFAMCSMYVNVSSWSTAQIANDVDQQKKERFCMLEENSGISVSKFAENKTEIMFIQCHYLNGLIAIIFYYTNQVKSQWLPQGLESCSDT